MSKLWGGRFAGGLDPLTGDLYITERAGLVKRVPAGPAGMPDFGSVSTVLDVSAAVLSGGVATSRLSIVNDGGSPLEFTLTRFATVLGSSLDIRRHISSRMTVVWSEPEVFSPS